LALLNKNHVFSVRVLYLGFLVFPTKRILVRYNSDYLQFFLANHHHLPVYKTLTYIFQCIIYL